jgi:hypothetical protein
MAGGCGSGGSRHHKGWRKELGRQEGTKLGLASLSQNPVSELSVDAWMAKEWGQPLGV